MTSVANDLVEWNHIAEMPAYKVSFFIILSIVA